MKPTDHFALSNCAAAACVALGLAGVAHSAQVVDLNCAWLRTAGGQAQTVDLPDDFRINLPWIRDGGKNRGFKPETNAVYRCAHNPYPEALLDLCDEMGILVVDELVDKWRGCWAGRKPFIELAPLLVSEWVRRGRNHPSVVLWSVGNETLGCASLKLKTKAH